MPPSDLIICYSAFAFSIFKPALDPISLMLHPGQSFKISLSRKVANRNLYDRIFPGRLGGDQKPSVSSVRLSFPYINRTAKRMHFQISPACLSQTQNGRVRQRTFTDAGKRRLRGS